MTEMLIPSPMQALGWPQGERNLSDSQVKVASSRAPVQRYVRGCSSFSRTHLIGPVPETVHNHKKSEPDEKGGQAPFAEPNI
jgi:hypothetical protein